MVSGYGHGVDAPNQLRGLSVRHGSKIRVLCGLAGLELQRLILRLEGGDLILSQEIQDFTSTSVLAVNDISCAILDGILDGAGVGRHVVVHAVDSALGLAAAVLCLSGHVAHLRLDAVEALEKCHIGVVEAAGDAVIQRIGAVTDALLDSRDAALNAIERNGLVHIGTGG